MNKVLIAVLISCVLLLVACGSGGNPFGNIPNPGPTPTGNYSVASLNGRYVYSLRGVSTSTSFNAAGAFTADGAGHISAGTEDDMLTTSSQVSSFTFSGTYTVTSDGRGEAVLNYAGLSSPIHYRFVLVSTDRGRIMEMEQSENAIGALQKQDASATLSGSYVFRFDGLTSGGLYTSVGAVSAAGGSLSGVMDENNNGVFTAQNTVTGTYTVGAGGRGTAAIAWGGVVKHVVFYAVNATRVEMLGIDPNPFISGYAAQQTGTPFSNASLNAGIVFTMSGVTGGGTIREAGRFNGDGNGNILSGSETLFEGGSISDNVAFTGTYSMAPSGRAPLQLTYGGQTFQFVLWMTSPTSGILMAADNQAVESGLMAKQTGAFSNATVNGPYALRLSGDSGGSAFDAIAQVRTDGAGNMTGNQDVNASGSLSTGVSLPGTYTVGTDGRATATFGSTAFRLYLVNANTWYGISFDQNLSVLATGEKQQ